MSNTTSTLNAAELKTNVETLSKQRGESPLTTITALQSATAKTLGDGPLLDALCELKNDYLDF